MTQVESPAVSTPRESTSELLGRARAQDGEALDALLRRYLPLLQRFAHGRLPRWARRHADTDDLVQETVTRTVRQLPLTAIQDGGSLLAYMRQAVVNGACDAVRQAARRPQAALDTAAEPADSEPSPLEQILGRESLARYEAGLARLPEEQRAAILARLELGLPYEEIADLLGRPSADAARMTVARAVARLARELSHG